jgi:putative nucleotidyltransferase with HDIG domain
LRIIDIGNGSIVKNLVRIAITKVEVGMFISEQTPGLKEAGLNSRGLISRLETLKKLQAAGIKELYIDISKGKSSRFVRPIPARAEQLKPRVGLKQERERAEAVYGDAKELVGNLLRNVKMGQAIDVGPVNDIACEINESVLNNANALLCLSHIREKSAYLLEHSINVGILMGVFTRFLGFSLRDREQLITGALLHDIGKIRVSNSILDKPGKLTGEEWAEMQRHVEYGEEVLRKSEGISAFALSVCTQHHEKLNGEGYPRGIGGDSISLAGRLATIVDIYDALTADRCYHEGKTPFEAIKIMSYLAGDQLDRELFYQFIHCMSVYPVGSLIELNNGRLAVVIQINNGKPKQPIVRVIYNARHRNFETIKVVDLSAAQCQLSVSSVVDPDKYDIDIREFL